ncbi:MAG: amidase family protein [Oscillospiraceae bacterium]|nr:amidase family protein [Oscillospiraceae bacterium]
MFTEENINESTISELQDAMQKNELTSRKLILHYLSRIASIDKCDGGLNSVLEVNPDALFIADTLDAMRVNGTVLGPLHGIPVMLKDNISTGDKMHTSAGSVALQDNFAPYDAHIVKLLREAGAVILGKTNMTEFANYMTRENMPTGYSSRGGQVLNPYNKDKHPGGSSSGSGVAVAAGLCTVAIGTETAGSIMSPAMQNGIVGIKPTLGLVSRSGIIPISSTHDTAGPMARTVRDAAVLLSVIAQPDPNDFATQSRKFSLVDYTKYLDKDGLKGVRIGINRSQKLDNFALSEEEKAIFENMCKVISNAGALLIDNVNIDAESGPPFNMREIMQNEFKACMNYYLSTLHGSTKIKTMKDIIEYNQANAAVALKYGQSILLEAENNTSGTMTEPKYIDALNRREEVIAEFNRLFDDNNIDVMVCETFTNIAAFTGFPSMTVPIGQKQDKIPIGSFWISRRFDEKSLFRVTYALEQILNARYNPCK